MSSISDMAPDEVRAIAEEAYVFGFPLVLMDVTQRVITAVARPDPSQQKAPINQFLHLQRFPDASFTTVVSPNADTLYSAASLDVSKEPIVLSVPEMGDRYYLMPLLDAWTNVMASPGTRTTGQGKGAFAIVGPHWSGELPAGVKEIRSPTNIVWLIGRTQTNGARDYDAVHAIQSKYRLTPLSAWGTDYHPPDEVPVDTSVDTKTAPVQQVVRMSAEAFFARLTALMVGNPPTKADAPAMARFSKIGIEPGKRFALADLDAAIARSIQDGVRSAFEKLAALAKKRHGENQGGWEVVMGLGSYGTNYPTRALVALVGLGANLSQDAIYPFSVKDVKGNNLNGANRYTIRFAKGQHPPVNAFWSVTMYNDKHFFVDNPLDRYAIGDRNELKIDKDGSLTLYVQNESPGKDKESNWLPAPKGPFNMILRMYWPKSEVLEGQWKCPPINAAAAPKR
jgi:hypothetical protein